MAKGFRIWVALAAFAAALACSGGDDKLVVSPSGTCNPSAHTTADPTGAAAYCRSLSAAMCHRGFNDCANLELGGMFPTEQSCAEFLGGAFCTSSNEWYDAPCGDACLAFVLSAPCSVFDGAEPQACAEASGSLPPPPPPPPPTCAGISPGTFSDTITSGDPLYGGGYSRAYCISFTAGQSVTIDTAAPLSGSPIGDTVVHLIDPSGTQIAYNDDFAGSFYSHVALTIPATGEYRIVVHGYSTFDVGSYLLTVTGSLPPPPPPPPTCAGISPGTFSDTITSGDPLYGGGYSRAYCISFTAGQSVTIDTAAPLSGIPIFDTVVHLIDPSGTQIAYNDDFAGSFYSHVALTIPATGEYRIVVHGYSTFDVGSYRLTITAL